jgi:translation initiation factor 2 beta subunit (eIF-2beta)/eIF-5
VTQNKRTIHRLIENDNLDMFKIISESPNMKNKYFSIDLLIEEFYYHSIFFKSYKVCSFIKKKWKINIDIKDKKNNFIVKKIYGKNSIEASIEKYIMNKKWDKLDLVLSWGYDISKIILNKEIDYEIRETLKIFW